MSSMRARHSRGCALGGVETAAPQSKRGLVEGCTCSPTLSIRGPGGRSHQRIGRDLGQALKAFEKTQREERAAREGEGARGPRPRWLRLAGERREPGAELREQAHELYNLRQDELLALADNEKANELRVGLELLRRARRRAEARRVREAPRAPGLKDPATVGLPDELEPPT